jgi:hypothetical protein
MAGERARRRDPLLTRLLFVAYFLEVGLLLVLVPWSPVWERNYFMDAVPALEGLAKSGFVRGAVTGLGIVNLVAGLVELRSLFSWRRRTAP